MGQKTKKTHTGIGGCKGSTVDYLLASMAVNNTGFIL